LKTAIIEKDRDLGAACLSQGCIPTKEPLHSAHGYDLVNNPTKLRQTSAAFGSMSKVAFRRKPVWRWDCLCGDGIERGG
jgi:pyruvate/2-oxoglutarate dehydrogenase complex dihydrolipoamide dehydrogenase (E3) component